jgi:hypothetical protein
MGRMRRLLCLAVVATSMGFAQPSPQAPTVAIGGDLRQWHRVTLTLDGPHAEETANEPNPFRDYRMTVTFAHESGVPTYNVPGYFAADGNAANSSARAGNKWRAHLAPDKVGRWDWRIAFVRGKDAAIDAAGSSAPVQPFDGLAGSFRVSATNKRAPDFRARGRLEYVGDRYLRFAGTGEYFLKVGTDSPETLLAYADFDDTKTMKPAVPLHVYEPHLKDWTAGDPSWKEGKGKGLLGVINYLSSKGANSISFLTYNAGGDGDNVWPFVSRDDKFHYDVSKLDQWQIVFDHAQAKGLYLHVKLQETENDDNIRGEGGGGRGKQPQTGPIVESLDNGDLGPERKLYLRETIARFGHALALNWNLGEENTQSVEQQLAMSQYLRNLDPYRHHIVVHTHPGLAGRRLLEAPRRSIGPHRRFASESVVRSARADTQMDRGLSARGEALGRGQRRAGICAARRSSRSRIQGLRRQGREGQCDSVDRRHSQDDVVGKPDGWRSGCRVLLRLLAPRERSRRRGSAEPRQELGFRPHRARFLPYAPGSVLDDDECRWTGRQHDRRQQQVVFGEDGRNLSRLPADRRHGDPRFARGLGVVHRFVVRSPERWRAETRECGLGESGWSGCARPGSG